MDELYVIHVTEQDFQREVLDRSREVPVLVDFWAPWCAPCKALGPILERLAGEHQGAFLLAKVNTDENPQLAQAFQIQSIPAVHLVADGKVVDGFVGARPEAEIRELLRPHLRAPGDDALDETLSRAELEARVAEKPDDAHAHLLLARIAFEDGDEDAVRRHVEALPEGSDEAKSGAALLDGFRFRSECGGDEAVWRRKLGENPEDLDARYALGCCLAADRRYEEALTELLEVVKRDRRHRDGAAHRAMLTIFGLLDPGSDVVRDYRRQLVVHL